MNKLLLPLLLTLTTVSWAGLITRPNTYTAGDVIRSNDVNTNETTIYDEFNGNIESANILDGTIVTGDIATGGVATIDIADNAVTYDKLAAIVQSTVTLVVQELPYKRPPLIYVSATQVDVASNTSVNNETCIIFRDGVRRCVTENVVSTDKYRRFTITATAEFTSGTEESGLRSGLSETANTWYSIYAVKSLISTGNFVLAGDTTVPIQANTATLNSTYGTNGWVYLGVIRNGNSAGAPSDINAFKQSGNRTLFNNTATGGGGQTAMGIALVGLSGLTTTYTYSAGTSDLQIPGQIDEACYHANVGGHAGITDFEEAAGNIAYLSISTNRLVGQIWIDATVGASITAANSALQDIFLCGFVDGALNALYAPLY